MATLGNANNASEQNTSRRSYISTAPFYTHFFTYTTYLDDLTTRGRLTQVAGANCTTCPTGRILRENGRKLYPDANPDITKYLVGVYDSVTFLSGYINPNDSVFAIYNSDRPNYIPDNNDGLEGAPVLTTGNVISTEGFVGVQSTIAEGELYAGAYLNSNGIPIVQAGVNFGGDCQDSSLFPSTFATLYPDGTIESITYRDSVSQPSTVRLTANGNTFNTGNVSTMGNTYVQGNVSTSGQLSVWANSYVQGNTYTLGSADVTGNVTVGESITAVRQIRSSTRSLLSRDGSGNVALDASLGSVFYLEQGDSCTINASNNTLTGAKVYIYIRNTDGSNDRTIAFGTGFVEQGNLVILSTRAYSMSFYSDGINLVELSRALLA
jgi:hypothetical protein